MKINLSLNFANRNAILFSLLIPLFAMFFGNSLYAQTPVTTITDYVIFGGAKSGMIATPPNLTTPASPGYGVQIGYSSYIQGGSIGSYTLIKSVGNMTCGTATLKTNIYSGGTVVLANNNAVTGNIAAGIYNTAPASGTIFSAGTGEAFSGRIDINGNIVIGGGSVTGTVTNPVGYTYKLNNVTINNTKGTPVLPILPQQMPAVASYSAGSVNKTGGSFGPGAYGTLTIANNGTVTLSGPGTYIFKSIKTTGPNASIIYDFQNATAGKFIIYVVGDVSLNKTSVTIKNGGDATRIYTEVHGTGSTNTADKTASFIMSNGSNGSGNVSGWFGSVWAPYAAIKIGAPNGPSMSVTGALWSGTQVNIGDGVSINYVPCVLCNPPAITTQPTSPSATCSGSGTQTLNVAATGTELSYSWRKGGVAVTNGGTVSGQGTPTLTLTNPSTSDAGNYDVVVTGTCGAVTSNAVTVTVNALPTISGNLNVCVGSTTTLTGSGTADALMPWVSANTSVATISNTGVVTPAGTDGGTSVITYKNNKGCTATATVTVNPQPVVIDAGGPDKPYNFDGITTIGNPGLTGFSFKWTAPPGGLITTADDQATISVGAPGIYTLALKSALGCTATDDVLVSNKVTSIIGSELTSIFYNNPTGLPSPFFVISQVGGVGYVRIDVIVNVGNYGYVLNLLQQTAPVDYGLINIVTNGENGQDKKEIIITGDFPIANLLKLNDLDTYINYCRPFYEAFSNSGLVNSAGDTTMRSNLVRSGYKITGDGVKVGIISNSFTTITNATTATLPLQPITTPANPTPQTFITNTAAQDLTNGDLSPVTILQDYPIRSTDEGRAMAQIVHDVAPGAQLYFRTGYFTAGDFATGIKQLAAAGCKVIVDDLTYFTEPFLKDGVVAKTVDEVKAQGVSYFSSAGNFSNKSYEKDFRPVDAAAAGFSGKMAHNFSNTAGAVDIFQHVKLAPGNYTIVLQWVDDIYSNGDIQGTHFDVDMYYRTYSVALPAPTQWKGFNRDNSDGDPLEIMPFIISDTTDADFLILNNNTDGNPVRFKYVIYRGDLAILEYNEGTSTLVGQANAAGAIAVGASRYDKAPPYLATPSIESFSSIGGTKTEGVVRYKPDIVGPDGVNTTVKMGQDYPNSALDGYSNFFGTSAAAPHAAAVAALIIEGKKKFLNQDPSLTTPDEMRSLLQLTAVDMETASNLPSTKFDYISGYGLVDADSAMRTFAAPAANLIELVVPPAVKPCNGAPFTITITGENFSRNTVVYLINGPGDSTIIIPNFISSEAVTVTINSCIGNPEIKAYTPPKSGTNGKDGGFSNSKHFFSAYVTVDAVNVTKKYGETLGVPDTVIRVNGTLLQDTTLTLQDIGLAGMTVTTAATSLSDVGTYAINVSRIFDPGNAADVEFQKNYNYKFTDGTVTIAKMPLRVTPDNKTITYGQNIGRVTFKYDFDRTNVLDPASLETIIRNYHEAYLPGNALAVIRDFKKTQLGGSTLDTTKLRNLNMVASFNAVNNSRKFTLSANNTLAPITDASVLQNNLNVQYLLDIASESIFNYSQNPSSASFYSTYPGINSKAVLGAAAIASEEINSGLIEVPGTAITSKVLNGTLAQTVSGTGGPVVPIVGGFLVQVTDAELTNPASSDLAQYINGNWYTISSDASGIISLNKIVNQILRGANGLIITVDGSGNSLVSLPGGATSPILTNAILRGANGSEVLITVNSGGIDVPVPDGALIEMENGDLVQFNLNSFSFNVLSNGVILRGANGAILRGANGAILRGPNGAILRGANGAILRGANGAILRGANGAILRGANGLALGADSPDNNTGAVLDSDDAANDGTGYSWLGSMFGVNMITGLDVGKQYLVPGALVDPNFDISYGLGEVNITKASITVTAATNTKTYDGAITAAALPAITNGSLAGGDIAVFKETYDNKNQGSSKTMTPAVVSIVDALGVSVAANYTVTLTNSTNGVINKRDITLTAAANTKAYDGTVAAAALPAITTGSLADGDVAVLKETYDNKNQGSGKTMIPAVVSIADALNTSMVGNYNVTLTNNTNGVINKRDITVTAAANTKTYNGNTSAAALPAITTGTLANGDVAVFSETYDNKNQGTGKTMTPAVVSIVDALNAGMAANYNVTLSNSANGVINKAPLAVRADNKTRKYGENNPVLTVSYSGFVNSEDSVTSGIKGMNGTGIPSASTTATPYSAAGTYPITAGIGTLAASSNYTYSFVNGVLTVTNNSCLITHSALTNCISTSSKATSMWFTLTTRVSGQLVSNGDYLIFRTGSVTFSKITSNPIVTNLAIPNGKIIADNTVSSPITSYDAGTTTWITRVPPGFNSTADIFITGAIINSSNGFVKQSGASTVAKGMFYSNKSFTGKWTYALAAYQPQFTYASIAGAGQITSVSGTNRAGTPNPQLAGLVSGGSGSGGKDYTGSPCSLDAFTACMPSDPAYVSRGVTAVSSIQQDDQSITSTGEIQLYPNPASTTVTLLYVPKQTGTTKITVLTADGKMVIETGNGIWEAGKKYTKNIDLSRLARGVYMIQVTEKNAVTNKKIIIGR